MYKRIAFSVIGVVLAFFALGFVLMPDAPRVLVEGAAAAETADPDSSELSTRESGEEASFWNTQCSIREGGKRTCMVYMAAFTDEGAIMQMTIILTEDIPLVHLIVSIPPDVTLPPGIEVRGTNEQVLTSLTYTRCYGVMCNAEKIMAASFLDTLKGEEEVAFVVTTAGGETEGFLFPLGGLERALADLPHESDEIRRTPKGKTNVAQDLGLAYVRKLEEQREE